MSLPLNPLQKLIQAYQQPDLDFAASAGEAQIQVSAMASRMAFVYERMRNALEYQEVHLIRKNAIERTLKRRLIGRVKPSELAPELLSELIRGRYLPDNMIPEHKVSQVANILNKYFYLFNRLPLYLQGKERAQAYRWLLGIAAVEIDHCLISPEKAQALAEYMYATVAEHITVDQKIPVQEKNIQVYLAVHRALLRSDPSILRYHLFRYYNDGWYKADRAMVESVAANIKSIKGKVDAHVDHKIGDNLFRYLKKYTIYYHVTKDIIEKDPATFIQRLNQPAVIEQEIIDACTLRYKQAKDKLGRSAVRAIIYIFITKMLLALILEIPYDLYLGSAIQYIPLGINIVFHPFLLFMAALTVRIPAKENTLQVLKGIQTLLTQGNASQVLIRRVVRRRPVLTAIFNVVYVAIFITVFGFIIYLLDRFGFNPLSISLFILFLTLVSFFGIKLREDSKEYIVVRKNETTLGFLIDLFSMPVVRAGRWISQKSPKINVIVFFFDFVFETPYKSFVHIFEELTKFVREKKEEL
ncbi:MAG: hypothetical protein WC734_02495 [Patescibacteria group bacterium]|jgi:hypothetical protein